MVHAHSSDDNHELVERIENIRQSIVRGDHVEVSADGDHINVIHKETTSEMGSPEGFISHLGDEGVTASACLAAKDPLSFDFCMDMAEMMASTSPKPELALKVHRAARALLGGPLKDGDQAAADADPEVVQARKALLKILHPPRVFMLLAKDPAKRLFVAGFLDWTIAVLKHTPGTTSEMSEAVVGGTLEELAHGLRINDKMDVKLVDLTGVPQSQTRH